MRPQTGSAGSPRNSRTWPLTGRTGGRHSSSQGASPDLAPGDNRTSLELRSVGEFNRFDMTVRALEPGDLDAAPDDHALGRQHSNRPETSTRGSTAPSSGTLTARVRFRRQARFEVPCRLRTEPLEGEAGIGLKAMAALQAGRFIPVEGDMQAAHPPVADHAAATAARPKRRTRVLPGRIRFISRRAGSPKSSSPTGASIPATRVVPEPGFEASSTMTEARRGCGAPRRRRGR